MDNPISNPTPRQGLEASPDATTIAPGVRSLFTLNTMTKNEKGEWSTVRAVDMDLDFILQRYDAMDFESFAYIYLLPALVNLFESRVPKD